MDDPPGEFLAAPIASLLVVGSVLAFAIMATLLAAAFAAGRTALYFAGLVSREDMVWACAAEVARGRAERWLPDARLLTVAIQFYHTIARVVAVVSLVASNRMLGSNNVFLGVILPAVLSIVLTEAVARLFARKHPVEMLSRLHALLGWVSKTTLPVTRLLDRLNGHWRSLFGNRSSAESALAQMLELAAASEAGAEKEVVKGIVNFGVLRVKDVMKQRDEMSCLSTASNFDDVIAFINACGYSRIPIFKESIDQIEGVLYTKDLLPFFEEGKDFPWMNVLRPGYFVGADKKIEALLKDFQEKRVHIALVRDDQGNTVGLITLKDLIELVIREINEQPDAVNNQGYSRIDDRTYIFSGKASVHDVFRLLDAEHPSQRTSSRPDSLEDFIVEINDELPEEGEEVNYDQFTFVVEEVENKRIKRVRVNVHAQA